MRPSLKELVEQQETRDRESSVPKYLSKEERQRLALERETEPTRWGGRGSKDPLATPPSTLSTRDEQLIKDRHLGSAGRHPLAAAGSSRRPLARRLCFDWDQSEDTSNDQDPLYRRHHQSGRASDRMLKDSHWTVKPLADMTERDWTIVREDFNISIQGAPLGRNTGLLRSWKESQLPSSILEYVARRFDAPTPIQRQVLPLALTGLDIVGLAETGSGKTLAYILPILSRIVQNADRRGTCAVDGPHALVIVPTRELAQQIELAARPIVRQLTLAVLVGGQRLEEQSFGMRNGAELVIGTPGRVRDFLERHLLVLNQCATLVLDEADRMIDMNYEEDLLFILEQFPGDLVRQTMMFSATMPASCDKIAKGYMRRHQVCTVMVGAVGNAVDTVEQMVVMVADDQEKGKLLPQVLQQFISRGPIIVFVNHKKTVDYLCDRLCSFDYTVTGLHGGKAQEQRELAIHQLRTGRVSILVATDVAGRGIDLPGVALVLNYDMPLRIEEYIHRIGRTGRAGSSGSAITFLGKDDTAVYYDLRQCLQRSPKSTVPPALAMHEASLHKPGTATQKRRRDETIYAFGV